MMKSVSYIGVLFFAVASVVVGCGADDTTNNSSLSATGSTSTGTAGEGGSGGAGQGGTADGGSGVGGSGGAGGHGPPQACIDMVDTAQAFLDSLSIDEVDDATAAYGSDEHTKFEFLPPLSAARDGLSMKDMTTAQRDLLASFMQSAMSQAGYMKIEAIRALESVLAMQESGMSSTPNRDPENYFVQFYGTPAVDGDDPWGFRFEGHHLSVQGGVIDCEVYSATPAFWGASPQLAPLQSEIDTAAQLVASLDGGQQGTAQGNVSGGTMSGANKSGKLDALTAEGLRAGDMQPAQVQLLRQLVGVYLGNMNAVIAAERLAAIETAGFDDVTFLYSGNAFRVMGPTFIIELIYAGNTHIHSVWRDYDNDYGDDLIAQHAAKFH